MAQYNKNTSGYNSYKNGDTIHTAVDITNLNIKGVNNITLLDYTDAVVKKGSEIDSSLAKGDDYLVYGAPSKWIVDKEQQYNNCGVVSSMNLLSIAGLYDIKDQTKSENEFTLWAITNKFTDSYGEESTYAEDVDYDGELDFEDGGTIYEQREKLLEHYGLESESLCGYAEESSDWVDDAIVNNENIKNAYQEYSDAIDEANNLIDEYNRLWDAGKYDEADAVLDEILYYINDVIPEKRTAVNGAIVNEWNQYFKANHSDEEFMDSMVNLLKEGKAIIAGGDARYLWPGYEDYPEYAGHAITVLGVVCDSTGDAVGFIVQDTGNPDLGFTFVSTKEMFDFMTSGGTDYYNGVTQINVTTYEIKSWADSMTAVGNKSNNIITGNESDNVLKGMAGNDQLIGNGGNDTLEGGDGNDVLTGGLGDDVLDGGNGNDILTGSEGDDVLRGGAGNDTYVFSKLCGNDIVDFGTSGSDKLIFTDVAFDELSYEKSDLDLVISYNKVENPDDPDGDEVAETVTIKDYFKSNNHFLIVEVQDSSGETRTLQSLITGSIEIKFNEDGATLVHGTFLDDNIVAPTDNVYNDTIYGAAGNDTITTYGGNDLIYGDSYDEETPFGDVVEGETYDDYIEAGLGDDTIYGEAGNNILVFNSLNTVADTLTGGADITVGDGNDVVYSGQGTDALLFKDSKYEDLTFTFEGNNLVIKYGADKLNPDSQVTIVDYLKDGDLSNSSVKYIVDIEGERYAIADHISGFEINGTVDTKNDLNGSSLSDTITGANLVDTIHAGAGNDYVDGGAGSDFIYGEAGEDYLNGGAGNDEIYGGDGDDVIVGGVGKDKLYGEGGNNKFEFNIGDGDDTVYSGSGNDTLVFKDVTKADLTFVNDNNGNLVIKYGPADNVSSITIDGYFDKRGETSITNIIDSSGDNFYIGNLLDGIIMEPSEYFDNELNGTYLRETITGSSNRDIIYGNSGNDTIYGNDGSDNLYGGDGDDKLFGGAGNDELYGEAGHNEIEGGAGNDTISGGLGENRIVFNSGDGNDVLLVGKGSDTLVFKDFEFSKLEYTKDPYSNDLIIRYGNVDAEGNYTDSVTIKDYFNTKVEKSIYRIEALYETGSDEIITREMNFIINDKDTVVVIESPDSQVNNFIGSVYNDHIVGGDAPQFTLNYYNGGDGNDTIEGSLREDSILGGNGNDLLYGGADRDTILGGNGDDTIYGDDGSDLMYGEAGENTFHFNAVENPTNDVHLLNNDTIVSGKGTDILVFDNAKSDELTFFQEGNDLIIRYGENDALKENNSVTIQNYFKSKGKVSVKTIKTSDGVVSNLSSYMTDKVLTVVAQQDVKNSLVGSYNNDDITGGNLSDTLKGANGNDTINGADGDDKLYGENGNDSILGGNGNDYIDGGAGNDYLNGGENDDTIYGNSGNDEIYGATGDDKLYGVSGNNNFYFTSGDGNDTVYSGKGSDTLNFTDAVFADMKFIRSGNDLIIQYNATGDTVTLSNYAKSSSNSIKTIVDKDNTQHSIQSEVTVLFDGNKGSANKMAGTYMKDSITGGYSNDTVDGGSGDDTIFGNKGNDSLLGGNGNDIIYGDLETPEGAFGTYDDNDIIKGGNGNDSIYGGYGNDKIYGEAGTNQMYFNITDYDGNDVVYSGKGYDVLNFKDLNLSDLKFTRSGKNLVITYENDSKSNSVTISNYFANKKSSVKEINTDDGAHTILNDSGIIVDLIGSQTKKNSISGTFLNDSLVGGDYNDTLSAGDGNDTVEGGAGHDIIKGGNGDDIITGGEGNDKLYGEAGNNRLLFATGDGQDTVYVGKGNDTLVFGDILKDDLTVSRVSDNLVLEYGTDDKVTISNYFKTNGVVSISAEFSDGSTIDLKELYNESITANDIDSASRTLKGSSQNDVITASGSKQKIYGYEGNDSITGGASHDSIWGGYGDDTINAGTGNDRIYGEAGTNLIEFKSGDGKDIVYSGKGKDILNIDDVFADLRFARSGKNLVIYYGDADDNITVANYFANKNSSVKQIITTDGEHTILSDSAIKVDLIGNSTKKNKITGTFLNDSLVGGDYNDTLYAGDGNDTVEGGAGNDIIKGGNGNDVITGGVGNDKLYGEAGENTIIFNAYDGNDVVYSGKGSDKLQFNDAELGDLQLFNDSKNNVVIKQKDATGEFTNSVTLSSYFKLKGNTSFTSIVDKNGKEYTISEKDGQIVLTDVDGNETAVTLYTTGSLTSKNKLYGTYLNDSIVGGNLADSITGGDGLDTIEGGLHNDTIKSGNGNDLVYGDSSDLTLYQGGHDKIYGGNGNDTLYGAVGNDSIYGENDNDSIVGGQGNDYLDGGNGDDVLYGDEGNDILKGGNGNDTLYGGIGDDKLYGDAGLNELHFKSGDGQDLVYSGKGTDTLVFEDVTDFSKLKFQNSGGNLVISYNDANEYDKVIVSGYFKSSSSSVKYVNVDGDIKLLTELLSEDGKYISMTGASNKKNSLTGSSYNDSIVGGNLADTIYGGNGHDVVDGGLSNDKLYGQTGRDTILGADGNDYIDGGDDNDSLYGQNGNDTIRGGNGDDYIEGGAGNDKLYGDAGVNTFKFVPGDGNDVIYSGKGHDILDFGDLNLENDFRFVKSGNDLIVYYGEATGKVDSVTISSYFKGTSSINTIVAKYNGETTTVDIKDFAQIEINGSVNKKNKITGTTLDDIISGGSQADTISAGDGHDVLKGGAGADSLLGGRDNDSIYGGTGNDIIKGGTGDDYIEGGLDNDKLYGESGENTFVFNDGDGRDTIYAGSGTDTLVFNGMTADDLNFVYDKASGSLIINYGSRNYDYVYLDSFIKNYGDTSVRYVETEDPDNLGSKVQTNLMDLINDKKVNITAEAKKTTEGTIFNDIITSNNKGAVNVNASSGNDSIIGGDYNDTLNGGADNDTVYGYAGNDYLYGGAGDDVLFGGTGQFNYLYGDAGNDILNGDADSYHDYLYGGSGNDTINASSIYFSEAYGGDGDDEYNVGLSATKISDSSGSADVVNVNAEKANIGLFFNVDVSGNIFAETNTSDLYMYDATKILDILNELETSESLPTEKLVQIENYFGKGEIEEIRANDDSYFTVEQINQVKENVATWLESTDYMSTEDVLATKDETLIAQLLQQYNVSWQSPTP